MRTLVLATLLLSSAPSAVAQLQAVTVKPVSSGGFASPTTVEIPEGKVLEIVTYSNHNATARFEYAGERLNLNGTVAGMKFPGPASFKFGMQGDTGPGDAVIVSVYRLASNLADGEEQSPFTGSAVVIPEDASGPVQIILESSTDLVNWTAANPGTYGSSTEKRFFRVRAAIQSNPAP